MSLFQPNQECASVPWKQQLACLLASETRFRIGNTLSSTHSDVSVEAEGGGYDVADWCRVFVYRPDSFGIKYNGIKSFKSSDVVSGLRFDFQG